MDQMDPEISCLKKSYLCATHFLHIIHVPRKYHVIGVLLVRDISYYRGACIKLFD